jgi:parvulin-like peptidyl-prolyl isomerase
VLDVKDGGKTPFKDVADAIKTKLAAKRTEEESSKKAATDQAKLLAAKDFAEEGRTLGLPLRDATVGRGEPIVGIGRDPKVEEAVFSLSVGGTSAPIKVPTGYAIVRVLQQSPAGVPPLEEIKARVIDAIKRERAEVIAMDRAKALVASLGKGGDFLAQAKADGFTTGETPLFSRAEPPKEARLPGGVLLAAVQTPTGQVSEPVKTGAAIYVVKTLERQPADFAGFDKQREELEKQALEQKRTQAWDAWIESQKLAAKIDLSPTATALR